MIAQEIPIPAPGLPSKSFAVQLSGVLWTFKFVWGSRADRTYLSIYRRDGTALFEGRKIVCKVDLLAKVPDLDKPPGRLIAAAFGASDDPPALGDLGNRVRLYYLVDNG
jgi:hypothetical protein